MIDVRMGQQHVTHAQLLTLDERQQRRHFVAGIDDDGLARLFARDDKSVLEERTHGLALNYHDGPMILAVLDDLMFTSKIKTTASGLGVAVVFARSAEGALAEMQKTTPQLVIFDLNNARTRPLEIVAAMKADAALAAVPTIGYASHVMVDVIDAARKAGVGQVMARSLFTQQLADILAAR